MASGPSSGQPSSSKTSAPKTDVAAFAAAELARWPEQGQSNRVESKILPTLRSCIHWNLMAGEDLATMRQGREMGNIGRIRETLSLLSPRPSKEVNKRQEQIQRPWAILDRMRVPIYTPAWTDRHTTAQSEPEYVFLKDKAAWLFQDQRGDGYTRCADKWPFKLSNVEAGNAIMWRSWHYSESKGEWVRVYRIMPPGQQPVPLQPPARIQDKLRRGFEKVQSKFACRPNKSGMQP